MNCLRLCSPDEYVQAQQAWSELGCETLGSTWMDTYIKISTCLQMCLIGRYRKRSLNEVGLDLIHFVSLPVLTFASCFKMTGVTVEHLRSNDMISTLSKRHFERGISRWTDLC